MGLASLILGIVSLASGALAFVPYVNFLTWVDFPAAVLAIILGAVALSKAKKAGVKDTKATVGLTLGIISIALGIVAVLFLVACAAALVGGAVQLVK